MSPTTPSRAARRNDELIHEALVSGLTPAQVAARYKLEVEQVDSANRRVLARRDALPDDEAEVETHRTAFRALFQMSIDGFRESATALLETITMSGDNQTEVRKVRR